MSTNESERDIAKRRVQARMGLMLHVVMYAVCNAGMVGIWALMGGHYPWFVWPMLGWGIGIVGHVLAYLVGPDSPGEDRAIARELRRMHGGRTG